MVLLLP